MTNTLNKIIHNGDEYEFPSGEVGVSDQANNIFTPGMKIWGGTQSDYQSLTHDSNTAYLLLADQPTPPSPWQPGANTLFYFPLSEDMLDHSGNSVSASGGGTITYQGGAGALISSAITINYNTQPTDFTASCYIKTVTISDIAAAFGNLQSSGGYKGWDIATNIYNAGEPNSLRIECLGDGPTRKQAFTPTLGDTTTRHLVTFVKDGTNSMGYFYIDGNLVGSQSLVGTASTGNYIISDGTMYMGDVILEDKCWTAQEIADYYDQTKGDYGIS